MGVVREPHRLHLDTAHHGLGLMEAEYEGEHERGDHHQDDQNHTRRQKSPGELMVIEFASV
ncbi:MAG: hypothetical protein BWY92_01096 [Firmicutes bacterium ADurb.BinA052]|nr:MAG: hypothetical protein BWY92_01096 [Firmicutes bacterium ADurb.BinA052]